MENNNEHIPVMLTEVLAQVKNAKPNFVVDCTVGRGGHFLKLLKVCDNLLGFDRQGANIDYVKSCLLNDGYIEKNGYLLKGGSKIALKSTNFSELTLVIEQTFNTIPKIIFADLGVSTHQIKTSVQGLSFNKPDDILDMRLDTSVNVRACDLLNVLSVKELEQLFKNLGEVSNYKALSKNVVEFRKHKKFETVKDFYNAGKFFKPRGKVNTATKPFMALRIAVNSEHINLKKLLDSSAFYIEKGCTLLILTFHSLEERSIKKYVAEKGYAINVLKPSDLEVLNNASSRSAKLNIITNEHQS